MQVLATSRQPRDHYRAAWPGRERCSAAGDLAGRPRRALARSTTKSIAVLRFTFRAAIPFHHAVLLQQPAHGKVVFWIQSPATLAGSLSHAPNTSAAVRLPRFHDLITPNSCPSPQWWPQLSTKATLLAATAFGEASQREMGSTTRFLPPVSVRVRVRGWRRITVRVCLRRTRARR